MDSSNSTALHPISNSSATVVTVPYHSSYYTYYPQNLNPNPNTIPTATDATDSNSSLNTTTTHDYYSGVVTEVGVAPPGVDSYTALSSYPPPHLGYEGQTAMPYDLLHQQAVYAVSSLYYTDPNAYNLAAKEAVRLYGSDPIASGQAVAPVASDGSQNLIMAHQNFTFAPNTIAQTPVKKQPRKPKKPKTKMKIVQSVYCEICKVDCTSKEVLDQHKLGKKHVKNLEKLKQATDTSLNADAGLNNQVIIGPQENPNKGKAVSGGKSRRKATETKEDLERKRRKVLDGGAVAKAVRTCSICNVVCNSETVYHYHIAGQKHAAMVKKSAAGVVLATAG